MHIVLLSHEYPPVIYGGVATFVENLARCLQRRGIKVTVIAGYPVPNDCFGEFDFDGCGKQKGIDIVRLPYLNFPPRQIWFQVMNFKKISQIIRSLNVDIIHGQSGVAFPAIINLKKLAATIVSFHNDPKSQLILSFNALARGGSFADFRTYALGYPVHAYSFKKEFEMSDAAVAVSETLMNKLNSEMGKKKRGETLFIHNGVDVEKLDKDYNNLESCYEESDRTILFAGRLFWGKGVLRLVEVAYFLKKEMPDFKIIVNGKGPMYGKMVAKIKELGLTNVELNGFADRKQMMRSLRQSSFVIIPSYYESCPMVLLEGMCLGKIPLMFGCDYSYEFTENGIYALIAKSPQELVSRLKKLYKGVSIKGMGDEVRSFARSKYDIRDTTLKYIKLYKEICS
jgi:glycogen(starch) synthase